MLFERPFLMKYFYIFISLLSSLLIYFHQKRRLRFEGNIFQLRVFSHSTVIDKREVEVVKRGRTRLLFSQVE